MLTRAALVLILRAMFARALPDLLLLGSKANYVPDWPGPNLPLPYKSGRNVPVLQYTISCNPDFAANLNNLWVNDNAVQIKVVTGQNCANYLQKTAVTVLSSVVGEGIRTVMAIKPPVMQTYKGSRINTPQSELNYTNPSSCCDNAQCPNLCILTPALPNCFIYVSTISRFTVNRPSDLAQAVESVPLVGTIASAFSTVDQEYYAAEYIYRIPCQLCRRKPCREECKNGEYASNYTDYDEDGMQVVSITCTACAPGTWNTCQYTSSCSWRIPSSPSDRTLGQNIHAIAGGPVGACYPCFTAASYLNHYVDTPNKVLLDPSIAWKCPGGTSAPVNCPSREFRQSTDGASCVCKPGFYAANKTACVPCPRGHRCPEGLKEKCPKHYYQTQEGQSECRRCVESASDTGFYSYCPQRGYQLKFCDPDVAGTQEQELESQCIPCNQCLRPYASLNDTAQSRCYRDR